jgi:hypothetical protein
VTVFIIVIVQKLKGIWTTIIQTPQSTAIADRFWIGLKDHPATATFNNLIGFLIVLRILIAFFVHCGTSTSTPWCLSTYTSEFKYMTNLFLQAKVEAAIETIQVNIDAVRPCLMTKK